MEKGLQRFHRGKLNGSREIGHAWFNHGWMKKKMKSIKANDNGYHDLVLANQNPVAFNLFDK